MYRIAILISGTGSNLKAIHQAIRNNQLHASICTVISTREEANGLNYAKTAKIPTHAILAKQHKKRTDYDDALKHCLATYNPDLIVLAGFMRLLTPDFVNHYYGRLINIHPALLPDYPGLNTHARVLTAGEKKHGISIHFVNAELDEGPLIAQAHCSIPPDATVDSLTHQIHQLEHHYYWQVIQWFATQQITLIGNNVLLQNKPLSKRGYQF